MEHASTGDGIGHNGKVLKCAVGCLIPDEDYDPAFERKTVSRLIDRCPGILDIMGRAPENIYLLSALQLVHDAQDVCEWDQQLKKVAVNFNLDPGVIYQHAQ